jgi:phospholipid/cholesterol/gamma-HCH transport system permease protein
LFLKNSEQSNNKATAELKIDGSRVVLVVSGDWSINKEHTLASEIIEQLPKDITFLGFDASALGSYDSSLISLILRVSTILQQKNVSIDFKTLPEGIDSMLFLATAVPSTKTKKNISHINFVNMVGNRTINFISNLKEYVSFFGDITIAFVKMLFGKARFRRVDLLSVVQKTGPEALPIVALISFLVGLILAFVGSIQLAKYGSEIFVADLVGIAMVREMGAMMVGIVMSGRTGASFAAELGAMKVNEEISAFKTFGISPIEFLVMPRIVALVCMFPLLTIFADVIGMLGGLVIGVGMFDLSYEQYSNRTFLALNLVQMATGVGKSIVYGIIVACVGCRMGLSCENSSSGVGKATTSSVVQSITWIIVADAVFAVIFTIFDI